MSRIAIFCTVPLWEQHHAEALELALEKNSDNDVILYFCDKNILGCTANPELKKVLCLACKSTSIHSANLLAKFGVNKKFLEFSSLHYKFYPPHFTRLKDLYNWSYKGAPLGRLVYSTLVCELYDSEFDIDLYKNRIDNLLRNCVEIFEFFINEIKDNNLDEILVWNGRRTADGAALQAAKKCGIKYGAFISGGALNSILLREGVDTINDITSAKKDMDRIRSDLSVPELRSRLTLKGLTYLFRNESSLASPVLNNFGFYNFHKNFSVDNSIKNFYKDKKIITFFIGTYYEFAGLSEFDLSDTVFKNFFHSVKKISEDINIPGDYSIVFRWHPNTSNARGREAVLLSDLVRSASSTTLHILPESTMDSYWLIENSDRVVSIGSSIAVEAAIRGKPTAFIGNNLFQHLKCFTYINSYQDLESFMKTGQLEPKYFDDAIIWGVYFSSFGNFNFKHLKQVGVGKFLLGPQRIVPKWLAVLKTIRRFVFGFGSYVKGFK